MVAGAVLPGVPVPHEEPVVEEAGGLRLLLLLEAAFVSSGDFPGKTAIERTRCLPPGATSSASTSSGRRVTGWASPPSSDSRQTCACPERVETKNSERPSADQRGWESPASWLVRRRTRDPSVAARYRSRRPRFASRSVVRTANATCVPSGETRGSEIRSMASMSWIEKGWVSAAPAGRARASSRTRASDERIRGLPRPERRALGGHCLSLSGAVQGTPGQYNAGARPRGASRRSKEAHMARPRTGLELSRRRFLQRAGATSVAALAFPTIVPASVRGGARGSPPATRSASLSWAPAPRARES